MNRGTGAIPQLTRREWRIALAVTVGIVLYVGYGPALAWWLLTHVVGGGR